MCRYISPEERQKERQKNIERMLAERKILLEEQDNFVIATKNRIEQMKICSARLQREGKPTITLKPVIPLTFQELNAWKQSTFEIRKRMILAWFGYLSNLAFTSVWKQRARRNERH